MAELAAIGQVRYVIAPNICHHLYFLPFLEACPDAIGYVAHGLHIKRRDLQRLEEIPAVAPWSADITGFFIQGLPVLNETAWYHPKSATLLLTDLLFCFSPENTRITRMVSWLVGVNGKLGMSRTMRLAIRDHAALAISITPLLSLPIERIVVAHDQVIEARAADQFRESFAWIR